MEMDIDNLVDDLKYLTVNEINATRTDMEIDSLIGSLKSLTTAELIDRCNPSVSAPPVAAAKNRCKLCRKRVGLVAFWCRCGGLFCGAHRYPEAHPCDFDFDFKTVGRAAIEKENPLCRPDKIEYRV